MDYVPVKTDQQDSDDIKCLPFYNYFGVRLRRSGVRPAGSQT